MNRKFDFMDNQVFDDRFSEFAKSKAQALPGKAFFEYAPIDTGYRVLENGDV